MHRLARYVSVALVSLLFTTIAEAAPIPLPEQPQVTPPGNPIIEAPKPSSTTNVTVNVTPPPPDPAATQAMLDFMVANTEYNHANVPDTIASGLLKAPNIWTQTPWDAVNLDIVQKLRNVARGIALGLFLLGIVWIGNQLAFGSLTGSTNYQQLFPMVVMGFALAFYSDTLAHRMIDLNNWICAAIGDPSLSGFTADALKLPDQPTLPGASPGPPGIIGVPASFFSGLLTTVLYAIVLILLEVKLIIRDGILAVASVVMPISGALWAFSITRGWGTLLYRMFFGWLFGQPMVVICLAIASSLFTFFNNVDGPAQVFIKIAVLFMAMKSVTIFASGSLGQGGAFGIASLLFLLRRAQHVARAAGGSGTAASPSANPEPRAATMGGRSNGQGDGEAATGRAWRPSYGTA